MIHFCVSSKRHSSTTFFLFIFFVLPISLASLLISLTSTARGNSRQTIFSMTHEFHLLSRTIFIFFLLFFFFLKQSSSYVYLFSFCVCFFPSSPLSPSFFRNPFCSLFSLFFSWNCLVSCEVSRIYGFFEVTWLKLMIFGPGPRTCLQWTLRNEGFEKK